MVGYKVGQIDLTGLTIRRDLRTLIGIATEMSSLKVM